MGYNFGVGREAPTFTISAVDGSEINLKQYRGDWFPVLVFVPTQAPGAAQTLAQLSAAADTLWGLRGQLLGICDAGRDEVKALADDVEGLSFPLLPDDGTRGAGRTARSSRTARCGRWRSSSTAPARSCGPARAPRRSSRPR